MTARPGRVKLAQDIDLPRPRHLEMLTTSQFMALKAHLLAALRQERLTEPRDAGK
jgi:hypothetical protein